MRISSNLKLATLVVASLMAISSGMGGRDGGNSSENGCAVGNANQYSCPSQYGR
mgnify:CR=1 FL=1